MIYYVNVYLGEKLFSTELVKGFAAAEAIQDYYRQWPEYEVDIEPNVSAYCASVGIHYPS